MSIESTRKASARYYATHPLKVAAAHKAYRSANRERLNAYQTKYRETHKAPMSEERKAYLRDYMRERYRTNARVRPKVVRVAKVVDVGSRTGLEGQTLLSGTKPAIKFSMTVACSGTCGRSYRRGAPTWYDGEWDGIEFTCVDCRRDIET